MLKMFPETLFFIGDEDPLHDDTVEMASKLLNNGVKCEINRYRWLGHGFLSFNTPGGPTMPEIQKVADLAQEEIIKTFNSEFSI